MGTSIARQVLDRQTMDQRPVVDSEGTTGESNRGNGGVRQSRVGGIARPRVFIACPTLFLFLFV